MKATFYYISLSALILMLAYSCKTEKKSNTPNDIVYDSISIAKIYHLENDSTRPSCSLKIDYLYPTEYSDKQILTKIQQILNLVAMEDEKYEQLPPVDAINEYVEDYINNYKREAKEQFPNWKASGDSEDYYSYYKTLDSKILFDMGGLLSYQVSSMDYKGGANSSTAFRNVVIDLKTGEMITEQDIFMSDYKSELNSMIIKNIIEQNKVQKAEDLIEFGYWGIEDLTSNSNFSVDDRGLTYVFNPGEYSAPSLGAINIFLTYEEIINILKSESPISILSGK